eukprot:1377714-Amorphochlora_amoeboformis.AAC.1
MGTSLGPVVFLLLAMGAGARSEFRIGYHWGVLVEGSETREVREIALSGCVNQNRTLFRNMKRMTVTRTAMRARVPVVSSRLRATLAQGKTQQNVRNAVQVFE